jgi:hypothetical protein
VATKGPHHPLDEEREALVQLEEELDSLLRIALSRSRSRSTWLPGRSRKSSTTGDFIR